MWGIKTGLWLEPFWSKATSHVVLRAERPASQLCGERTVGNVLFCPHYQPAACQALPFQAQGHTALGSQSSMLQQSPHPGLGKCKLSGKHLVSMPVALGLTYSTLEPPTTSIPEESGPHTHPFSPRVLSGGSSLTVESEALLQ